MKIKRMLVDKLNQRISGEIRFFDTLNVLTGPNGSGKTTLLKACWYLYSGNFKNALLEIDFEKMEIETDFFRITLTCSDPASEDPIYSVSVSIIGALNFKTDELLEAIKQPVAGTWSQIKDSLWKHTILVGLNHESLFFPTFRRVEGGFSLGNRINRTNRRSSSSPLAIDNTSDDELTKALKVTSSALSSLDNKFVCSMSVADVEKLVSETKARMDSRQKEKYETLAKEISTDIRHWQISGESDSTSAEYLRKILREVTEAESERDTIAEPMHLLNRQISQYFPNRVIKVNQQHLGTGSAAIEASALSAGEKQLLSFLCYAALNKNYVFMVDEPELSLHLDWQRKLISSLTALGPTHQYFFVTHSPAIYTKFADFEISFDKFLE